MTASPMTLGPRPLDRSEVKARTRELQSWRSSLSVVLFPRELDGHVSFGRLLELVCKTAGVQ
ncbi:MAG: hypothetical protein M3O28_02090 [Actinomycetota bacterium]|nr:hypothetical protein [Actinomycetota bacterium]